MKENMFLRLRNFLRDLNLFDSGEQDVDEKREQIWSTRIYLVLLVLSLVILVVYTATSERTMFITVQNPSFEKFQQLGRDYSSSLKCPCSKLSFEYQKFVKMQPTYHDVCSSHFVSDQWITDSFAANLTNIRPIDVRTVISSYGQIIRSLCSLSKSTLTYALEFFLSSPIVTANALSVELLYSQVETQTKLILSSGPWLLASTMNSVRLSCWSDLVINGLSTNAVAYLPDRNRSTIASILTLSYDMGTNQSSSVCSCSPGNVCLMPGAIYSNNQMSSFGVYQVNENDRVFVPGIRTSCYAIEGVLASTLECFYNASCFGLFVSNASKFTPLDITKSSNSYRTDTIESLFNQLMVVYWDTSVSPVYYYSQCAPLLCTYSLTERNGILVIITTIIALIGGLNTVLHIVVPHVVRFWMKILKKFTTRTTVVQSIPMEQQENRIRTMVLSFWDVIIKLNLFDTKSTDVTVQKREIFTTRLYIVLLVISFIILFFYNTFTERTNVYTIEKPSEMIYRQYQKKYADTIQCPCKEISMPFSDIIVIEATFHQVCTSEFASPAFYLQLGNIRPNLNLYRGDFTLMSSSLFQFISTFCQVALISVFQQRREFYSRLFVNAKLLSPSGFQKQVDDLISSLIRSMEQLFYEAVLKTITISGANQYLSASYMGYTIALKDNKAQIQPGDFLGCSCLIHPQTCSMPAAFYDFNSTTQSFYRANVLTGIRTACLPMKSVLQSSLECWFTAECYQTAIGYWQNRTMGIARYPPLLNSNIPSRSNISSPFLALVEYSMVEQWYNQTFYTKFFDKCAPEYCTYTLIERADILIIITTLLGLFGGLNIAMKLLSRIFIRLITVLAQVDGLRRDLFAQLLRIPTIFMQMNFFYDARKSSIETLKKEKQSTRIYIVLLFIGLSIVLFYNIFSPYTITVTVENPTKLIYEQLTQSFGESQVKCPCSQISISYASFVDINITRHQICSSAFIEDTWIESFNVPNGDWTNFTEPNDFRIHGISFFMMLRTLCSITNELVNKAVYHSLTASMYSAQVLPQHQFFSQVESDLTNLKNYHINSSVIPFSRESTQTMQTMSVYSLNWKWNLQKILPNGIIPTEPVKHGNCSCALSTQCEEPMVLNNQSIPSIVIGCLSMESTIRSTLLCLYNQTCLNHINLRQLAVQPLTTSMNKRFPPSTNVGVMATSAFIEEWLSEVSYDKFFSQCQPLLCQYSQSTRPDALYIVTAFLGIYGGLSTALHFLLPLLIDFIYKIIEKSHNLNSVVTPIVQ